MTFFVVILSYFLLWPYIFFASKAHINTCCEWTKEVATWPKFYITFSPVTLFGGNYAADICQRSDICRPPRANCRSLLKGSSWLHYSFSLSLQTLDRFHFLFFIVYNGTCWRTSFTRKHLCEYVVKRDTVLT